MKTVRLRLRMFVVGRGGNQWLSLLLTLLLLLAAVVPPAAAIDRKHKSLLSLKLRTNKKKGKCRIVLRLNEGGFYETEEDSEKHRLLIKLYDFRNFGARPVRLVDDPIIKGVDIEPKEQYLEIAIYLKVAHYRYEVSLFEKPAMCVVNVMAAEKLVERSSPPTPNLTDKATAANEEKTAAADTKPVQSPVAKQPSAKTVPTPPSKPVAEPPASASSKSQPEIKTPSLTSSSTAPKTIPATEATPQPSFMTPTPQAQSPDVSQAPETAAVMPSTAAREQQSESTSSAVAPPRVPAAGVAKAPTKPLPPPPPTVAPVPGQKLFDQGLKAYQQGDFTAAAAAFAQVVAHYSDSPLAVPARFRKLDSRAQALLLTNGSRRQIVKVIEEFLAAARKWSDHPEAPWAFLQVARLYEKIEFYYEAAGIYRALLERFPTSPLAPAANFSLARLNFKLKRYQQAYDQFSRLLEKYPQRGFSTYAHFYRANTLYYLNRLGEALKEYRTGIAQNADFLRGDPLSLYLLGCTYHQLKRYPEAKEYFLMMRNLFPDNEYTNRALAKIGEILVEEKKPAQAMLMFTTVVREFPGSEGDVVARLKMAILGENAELQRRLVKINSSYAPLLDSEKAYRYLIDKHPDTPFTDIARLHLGRLLFRQAHYSKSREVLEEMLTRRLAPGLRDAAFTTLKQVIYAEIESDYQNGAYQEIVVLQNRYRDDFLSQPSAVYPFLWIAEALSRCGLTAAALKVFQVLRPLAVKNKASLKTRCRIEYGIAAALAELKHWEELQTLLAEMQSSSWPSPWRERMRLLQVRLLASRGRVREALRRLEKFESEAHLGVDEEVELGALRAELNRRKGAKVSALLALEKAVNLAFSHPDEVSSQQRFLLGYRLATWYYQAKKYQSALDMFAKLPLLAPAEELPELLFWQLRCQLKLKHEESGRKLLKRLERDFPDQSWTASARNLMKEYRWRQEKLE